MPDRSHFSQFLTPSVTSSTFFCILHEKILSVRSLVYIHAGTLCKAASICSVVIVLSVRTAEDNFTNIESIIMQTPQRPKPIGVILVVIDFTSYLFNPKYEIDLVFFA